jgi:hypothetical protein
METKVNNAMPLDKTRFFNQRSISKGLKYYCYRTKRFIIYRVVVGANTKIYEACYPGNKIVVHDSPNHTHKQIEKYYDL